MKHAIRLFSILLFLAGCLYLFSLSIENGRLSADINRLEAELGRMSIEDTNRLHFAEIESPEIPPEVAAHVRRVWQFRCYLPSGYDFMEMSGSGRVTKEGVYQNGGTGSSWGMPKKEAIHKLLTVSLQEKNNRIEMYYSLGGSSGTTTLNGVTPDRLDALLVQRLVHSDLGPRSFDQDTILPLLKFYDPSTEMVEDIDGKSLTTFKGGILLLCPKTRETALRDLRSGKTPSDFDPSWLATESKDE